MCAVRITSFSFERAANTGVYSSSYMLYQCYDGVKKNSLASAIISIFAKLAREMIGNSEVVCGGTKVKCDTYSFSVAVKYRMT